MKHNQLWYIKALLVSVAGLIFSLLVSAAILGLNIVKFGPVSAIERIGVDAGMQINQIFPWLFDPPPNGIILEKYTFVDVDNATCIQFKPRDYCAAQETVPVELVDEFLKKANASGAKVVIIDTLPTDPIRRSLFYSKLKEAAKGPNGPWIIAPYFSLPKKVEGNHLSEQADLSQFEVEPGSRLRLAASSVTNDPTSSDNVIRSYPVLTQISPLESKPNEPKSKLIPAIPMLAALLSSPDTETVTDADCYFYPHAGCDGHKIPKGHFAKLIEIGEHDNLNDKIFYTLPSFSLGDPNVTRHGGVWQSRYNRYMAYDLMAADGSKTFDIPSEYFKNGVVILSSSEPWAADHHMTPIGAMSGAEIVLNATRAFKHFSILGAHTDGDQDTEISKEFQERVKSALWGFPIFFLSWLVIFWLHSSELEGRAHSKMLIFLRTLSVVSVFVIGMVVALCFDLFMAVSHMRANATEGVATDVLTPVVALGLEGFAEASKVVSRTIENGLESLSGWIVRFPRWLTTKFNAQETRR